MYGANPIAIQRPKQRRLGLDPYEPARPYRPDQFGALQPGSPPDKDLPDIAHLRWDKKNELTSGCKWREEQLENKRQEDQRAASEQRSLEDQLEQKHDRRMARLEKAYTMASISKEKYYDEKKKLQETNEKELVKLRERLQNEWRDENASELKELDEKLRKKVESFIDEGMALFDQGQMELDRCLQRVQNPYAPNIF